MNIIILLIYVAIIVLGFVGIVMLLRWAVAQLGLPEPVMTVLMIVVAIMFLLMILGAFTGHVALPGIRLERLQ